MCFRHFDVPTPFCKFENVEKMRSPFLPQNGVVHPILRSQAKSNLHFPDLKVYPVSFLSLFSRIPLQKLTCFVYPKAALRLFLCVDFVLRKMKRNDHTTCVVYKSQCTQQHPFHFKTALLFCSRKSWKIPLLHTILSAPTLQKAKSFSDKIFFQPLPLCILDAFQISLLTKPLMMCLINFSNTGKWWFIR